MQPCLATSNKLANVIVFCYSNVITFNIFHNFLLKKVFADHVDKDTIDSYVQKASTEVFLNNYVNYLIVWSSETFTDFEMQK